MTQMARDIYQAYLDRVSRALLERDIACVIAPLPSAARTGFAHLFSASSTKSRRCAVRFWALGRALTGCGVNALLRLCTEAEFLPGTEATVSSGGTPATPCAAQFHAVPPYQSRMELVRGPDRWQSASIHSDIGDSHVTLQPDPWPRGDGRTATHQPAVTQCEEPSK
jgi:hypothetical protein